MNTIELAEKLFERYENTHSEIIHYYGLLAIYALSVAAVTTNNDILLNKCKEILKEYPNKENHPRYNFENYKIGGAGAAYLFYKGFYDEAREDIRDHAERTLAAPTDSNGIMCMPARPEKERIWIDTIYAVAPFMTYAGMALNEERYVNFAAEQTIKLCEELLDKTCGLLHQSRGFREDIRLVSCDHWSRGNGWAYVGFAALLEEMPKTSPYRKKLEDIYIRLSRAVLKYQTHKGVWRQEITSECAWDESSGSGLIAYGIGAGLRLGLLNKEEFGEPFKSAIEALVKYFINDDYSTNMSCQGCLCPGSGENKGTIAAYLTEVHPRKDEVHSYGCLMLALIEAYRNGIVDVDFQGSEC